METSPIAVGWARHALYPLPSPGESLPQAQRGGLGGGDQKRNGKHS